MKFKQCKPEVIYLSNVDGAQKELIDIFEYDRSLACLRESEERDEGFDRELKNRDLESIFNKRDRLA